MVNWLNEICSDSWKKCVLWPFNLKRSWFKKIFMIQSLWVHDRIVINVKLLKKSCRKLLKTVTKLVFIYKKNSVYAPIQKPIIFHKSFESIIWTLIESHLSHELPFVDIKLQHFHCCCCWRFRYEGFCKQIYISLVFCN